MRSLNSSNPIYSSPMEKEQFWSLINPNWDHQQRPMSQEQQFESALSSLVSSPSSNHAVAPADSVVIGELIGRLGSICNSGDMSPSSRYRSANNSCYSTPLNSPPKIGGLPLPVNQMQLSPISADPGFVERAAKFSSFGGRNYGGFSGQFGLPESGKLSRVSSHQSLKGVQLAENVKEVSMFDPAQLSMEMKCKFGSRVSGAVEPTEFGNGQEMSPISNRMTAVGVENSGRKRKGGPKEKGKEAANVAKVVEEENSGLKKSKSVEANGGDKNVAVKPKTEKNGEFDEKQGKDKNTKPLEPPKDYIHVRARRGQATDSHSLAERVRREKISERMKFLQDLVPGCNKVIGKAVMLDEIINYVQSLQRQVEFLSMKLTTVNPRLDFYVENMLPKDNHQTSMSMPHQPLYPLDSTSSGFPYPQPQGTPLQSALNAGLVPQNSLNPLDSSLHRGLSVQLPALNGFADTESQLGNFWEDDLQSVVQMGLGQSQENAFSAQVFHGN